MASDDTEGDEVADQGRTSPPDEAASSALASGDSAEDEAAASEPPPVPRRWSERQRGMDPQNRRRVIDACAVRTSSGWTTHFILMMVLSLLVAIMGLSANSAALVIGAMLLAPLMQPVLGTAASLTMALGQPLKRSLLVLTLASVGGMVLSYVVATFLRDGPLPTEVLSRTSPDARDLIVALAAGAAGAYATTREDLSSSLHGVAIAVALVPPLAVVGMTIEAGRSDLARGALLLYVTNLVAIVVAGVAVFVLTGFAPPRRLATTSTRVLLGGSLAFSFMIAVAVPLTVASSRAADDARDRSDVEAAVDDWLAGTGDERQEVDIDDGVVTVQILGFGQPRVTQSLERRIDEILGADTEVVVRWTQALLAPAVENGPSERELLEADVRGVVEQWLDAGRVDPYDITTLAVADSRIRIDVSSTEPPPGVDELAGRLSDGLGIAPELEVTWTPRTQILPADEDDSAELLGRLRRITLDWAAEQDRVEVVDVRFDGRAVVVDLIGPTSPDATRLEALLVAEVDAGVDVAVWFTERRQLVPAPTPTPTPVPTPTPTPMPTPTPTPGFVLDLALPTPTPAPG